jgi:monoamine oxidase
MRHDVVVLGAGLAGLSAAPDLAAGGADVVVLAARGRAGGRVEQTTLADGRLVQLGGEVIGSHQRAYYGLVEELGLTLVPAFPDLPGEATWVLAGGTEVGGGHPWMSEPERRSTAPTSLPSTSAARTSGSAAIWRGPCARDAQPPGRRWGRN